MRLALAVLLACAGCALPSLEMPALEGEEHTLFVDPAFSSSERAEIEAAVGTWRTETAGRVNVRLTDEPGADVELVRAQTGIELLGHFNRMQRNITIDADALGAYPRGVQAMTANMLGQFVGLPLHGSCGVLGRDCLQADFTEADRAVCAR